MDNDRPKQLVKLNQTSPRGEIKVVEGDHHGFSFTFVCFPLCDQRCYNEIMKFYPNNNKQTKIANSQRIDCYLSKGPMT